MARGKATAEFSDAHSSPRSCFIREPGAEEVPGQGEEADCVADEAGAESTGCVQ